MTGDTHGFDLEPEYIDAAMEAVHAELADVLDEPDATVRYTMLTSEQATRQRIHDAAVAVIKHHRGLALRQMMKDGNLTQAQLATTTGLGTQQRVSKLLQAIRLDRRGEA